MFSLFIFQVIQTRIGGFVFSLPSPFFPISMLLPFWGIHQNKGRAFPFADVKSLGENPFSVKLLRHKQASTEVQEKG